MFPHLKTYRLRSKKEGQNLLILGATHLVYGFSKAYKSERKESVGTTEYMRLFGGYGVTLECGGHTEPQSLLIAQQAILNTLIFLEMIEGNIEKVVPSKIIEFTTVFKKGRRIRKKTEKF